MDSAQSEARQTWKRSSTRLTWLTERLTSPEALERHLKALQRRDPRLKAIAKAAGAFEIRLTAGGFGGLARVICGQQLSVASARAIWSRIAELPGAIDAAGFLHLSDAELRRAGLSVAKVRTLRGIAEAVVTGALDFDRVERLPAAEAAAYLGAHKGIGPWTAEIYLMFCSGHPDIFPAGDLALQKAVGHAFAMDHTPTAKELIDIAAPWSPHRHAAALVVLEVLRGGDPKSRRHRTLIEKLSGPMLPPASGVAPRQLMVLLHGYGSDGNDLIAIGYQLGTLFPEMMFVAPNAPTACAINPAGYQWFPLYSPQITSRLVGAALARPVIVNYLEDLWAETGLSAHDTVLAGFSQGAMMALHVGTSLAEQLAAIVACSGAFLPPEGFGEQAFAKPPVALIHGDADTVVNVNLSREAAETLRAAGFAVDLHISHGVGHGIGPDGLAFAAEFLQRHLGAGP